MKIFNATNSSIDLPWTGGRLNIQPRSFSVDFLGDVNLVKLIVTTFTPEQIALLVCGPYELSMCAGATTSAVNYVVQTSDEIVNRFGLKIGEEKKEEKCECKDEKCCCDEDEPCKAENPTPTPEPVVEEPVTEEVVEDPAPKKKSKKTKKTEE